MTIYLVTVNGKVSQEAYKTLEDAQDFIHSRSGVIGKRGKHGYAIIEENGIRYEIHDVKVKGL